MASWKDLSRDQKAGLVRAFVGRSAREIAEQLQSDGHTGVTRNAVIGVMNRCNISTIRPGKPSHLKPKADYTAKFSRKNKPQLSPKWQDQGSQAPARKSKGSDTPEIKAVPAPGTSMPYDDYLPGKHCGFPLWSGHEDLADRMVCGSPCEPKRQYCLHHHIKTTQP